MATQAMKLKKEGSKFNYEEKVEEDKAQKKLIEEEKHQDDY